VPFESSNVCVIGTVGIDVPKGGTTYGFCDRAERSKKRRETPMKRRVTAMSGEALAAEIANLSNARIDELRDRWNALHGRAPSREIGRSFLTRAITYRLQERAYGGLKPSTCRLLTKAVEEIANGSSKRPLSRMAQSGTILIREWRGIAHRVTMLDDGVSFNGKRYRSLSEVAREITGSRWSGPRFFGLRSQATESNHAAS
jgi:hypothetical protein